MIEVAKSQELSRVTYNVIRDLRTDYFASVFSEVDPRLIKQQLIDIDGYDIWRDPNRAVGSPNTLPGQRYISPKVAVNWDNPNDGDLRSMQAAMLFADNVSSSNLGALGSTERWAKAHLPQMASRSYRTIRELVVDPNSGPDQQILTYISMLAVSTLNQNPKQPASVYLFDKEEVARTALEESGFRQDHEYQPDPNCDSQLYRHLGTAVLHYSKTGR